MTIVHELVLKQGCKNFRRGQGIYGLFSGIYPCRGGKSELRFLKENRREKAVLKTKITSQKFPNLISVSRKRQDRDNHRYKKTGIFRRFQPKNARLWQGWLDSNQRMTESESVALPLGDTPVSDALLL